MAHDLAKVLLEVDGGRGRADGRVGVRQLRAAMDSTPVFGAGRVEATLNSLGPARRQVAGLAAAELGTSAAARIEEAERVLGGHSRLKSALDRDGSELTAWVRALRLGLAAVELWPRWLEQ